MRRRSVAIYCREFLTRRMTFVYAHVANLERFRPVVLTTRRLHPDLFPFDDVHEVAPWTAGERLRGRLSRRFLGRFPVAGASATGRWARALTGEGTGLIHAHFGPGGLDMMSLARRLDVPLVVTFHGYDGSQLLRVPGYRKALRRLFGAAAAVICVCEPMRTRLVTAGCPSAVAHVRHLGIDTSRFEAAQRAGRAGPLRFLTVAGLSEKKGIPTALRAFAKAREGGGDLRYVLAGDGPARGEILKTAEDLGLGDAFECLGPIPHEEAARLMAASDVFVHPSEVAPDGDREGLPTAIMEAMATGLPVLSTRHEGIPELVLDGETGRLVPEGDVEGLAAAMLALAESEETRRRWGGAGARRVRAQFDLRRQVSEMEDFYEGLLAGHPSRT